MRWTRRMSLPLSRAVRAQCCGKRTVESTKPHAGEMAMRTLKEMDWYVALNFRKTRGVHPVKEAINLAFPPEALSLRP